MRNPLRICKIRSLPFSAANCFGRLLAVLATAFVLAGCNSQRSTQQNPSIGTYELTSVNRASVPCEITHQGQKLRIDSGVFKILTDRECETLTQFQSPAGQPVKRNVKATYTQNGNSLTFRWKGAGTTSGTLIQDTLTMNNEGMLFTYKRTHLPEPRENTLQ